MEILMQSVATEKWIESIEEKFLFVLKILRFNKFETGFKSANIFHKIEFLLVSRLLTSLYEAATIQSVVRCQSRGRGYLEIWYLYLLSVIQLLQVKYRNSGFKIVISFNKAEKNILFTHSGTM